MNRRDRLPGSSRYDSLDATSVKTLSGDVDGVRWTLGQTICLPLVRLLEHIEVETVSALLAACAVNLVVPGVHATDRLVRAVGKPDHTGDPADFGEVVAFVCSEPANSLR